jgi:pimeloyl-ACP methyl ester carboxylesterase
MGNRKAIMAFAEVNGAKLWYEITGDGAPVMHIHGAGFGHFNFATATPIESKYFRCIDFDLRGYGQSDQPIQDYDMEVWADDVVGLMDVLKIERAHIHGTSMGGMIAQVFGAKYADRTDRLVINCSAAKLDYAGRLTFQNWIDISEMNGCGSRTLAEMIGMQALSRKFLDGPDGPTAVNMIQDILEKSNRKEVYQRACQAMIDMDLRPYAKEIKAPTLVIGGDEDIMTPWDTGATGAGQSWLAENIPGAVKHVIKGSNHSTLFDNTEENMRVVVNFFQNKNDLLAAI